MNFFKIIDQLSEVDPDVLDRFDSRRSVFNSLGGMAKRTALAATPLFLGALFQKAYAGTTATPVEVLNYALTLELLEANFYRRFVDSGVITDSVALAAINQIKKHEDAHVALLTTTISSLGGTPVAGPNTANTSGVRFNTGAFTSSFPATYTNYLILAQALEDAGVRAYKGRAVELLGTDLLTVALQIHSVEARHAAHIRIMRGQAAWVSTNDDLAANSTTAPIYTSGSPTTATTITAGGTTYGIPAYTTPSPVESNVTQAGINLTNGLGTTYPAADAAAAFDEYLQAAEVLAPSRAGGLALL